MERIPEQKETLDRVYTFHWTVISSECSNASPYSAPESDERDKVRTLSRIRVHMGWRLCLAWNDSTLSQPADFVKILRPDAFDQWICCGECGIWPGFEQWSQVFWSILVRHFRRTVECCPMTVHDRSIDAAYHCRVSIAGFPISNIMEYSICLEDKKCANRSWLPWNRDKQVIIRVHMMNMQKYCLMYEWLQTGFGLVIGFIGHNSELQVVVTIPGSTQSARHCIT